MVGLPLLSPTMTKGTIAKWLKKEGEAFKPGSIIAEVETDKATVGFEATDEGYLARILVPEGAADLQVGTPIAIFVEEGKDAQAFMGVAVSELVGGKKSEAPAAAPAQPEEAKHEAAPAHNADLRASPSAWALSEEHHISLTNVQGTGLRGLITKEDVLKVLAKPQMPLKPQTILAAAAPMPVPKAGIRDIAPRFSLKAACKLDALIALQNTLKKGGFTVSLEALILKCVAVASSAVPQANASFLPTATRLYDYVDIKFRQFRDNTSSLSYIRDTQNLRLADIQKQITGNQADDQHCTFEVISSPYAASSTFQPSSAFVRLTTGLQPYYWADL
jgi:pyruvate dehydrogenase E2 component (dihydrolipoamide acetyltransferase)